ncbi:MAG: dTMP kinase [Betaproteobacteria bacterium]|nr:dTMP kinase [Betaproteobacteria bacterium]
MRLQSDPTVIGVRQRLITLEGIDGAGKSTHIKAMAQLLQEQGGSVLVSREPGGSALAERLRELLLHEPMGSFTELLLIFAARNDHVERSIRPALARGQWVLCDRFTDATWAYQGAGRGMDAAQIAWLEASVHADVQPLRTYWFDLDPMEAAKRRALSRGSADRFESEDLRFFERVRTGYQERAALRPDCFFRIDASQNQSQIAELLLNDLKECIQSLPAGAPIIGSDCA